MYVCVYTIISNFSRPTRVHSYSRHSSWARAQGISSAHHYENNWSQIAYIHTAISSTPTQTSSFNRFGLNRTVLMIGMAQTAWTRSSRLSRCCSSLHAALLALDGTSDAGNRLSTYDKYSRQYFRQYGKLGPAALLSGSRVTDFP